MGDTHSPDLPALLVSPAMMQAPPRPVLLLPATQPCFDRAGVGQGLAPVSQVPSHRSSPSGQAEETGASPEGIQYLSIGQTRKGENRYPDPVGPG